jgi:hypothetical protein
MPKFVPKENVHRRKISHPYCPHTMDGIPSAIEKTKMTKDKLQNSRDLSATICHFTS